MTKCNCRNCGHEWNTRKNTSPKRLPKVCPECKILNWLHPDMVFENIIDWAKERLTIMDIDDSDENAEHLIHMLFKRGVCK